MRILIVTHRYPPCYSAGTERYSEALAKGLVARGHEVHVCCAEKDVSQRDYSLVRRVHRGVEVHEIINNLFYHSFNETYQNSSVEAVFASVLEVVQPDVVHVQHLMYLSVGCLEQAADSGARVVMTLHDFGLECARMGQLLHVDGGLCETVEFDRCGSCLAQTPWNQSKGARMVGHILGAVRRVTGLDLAPRVTRLARKSGAVGAGTVASGDADASKITDAESHAAWARAAEARSSALVQAVQRHARHVFAPSRFLADRCLALGLDPGRVEFLPTGVQRVEAADVSKASHPQERTGPLAVLFLGTLVPAKGAHVLLEAYGRLNTEQRAGIDLRIFGPEGSDESYHKSLVQKAQQLGLQVGKVLAPHKVQAALAGADLLVVPSIWLENRPLVILEALSMGVPCLVSGSGGMAELVQPGRDGWWFDLGDADDLARVLGERSVDPEGTRSLRPLAPDLPSFDATVQRIEEVYFQLLSSEEDSS